MENNNNYNKEYQLKKLENLDDWKVHENDTDIRGWKLFANGVEIGEVENLIANTQTEKVQYIEVELDNRLEKYRDQSFRNRLGAEFYDLFGQDDDRKTIIPIGLIEIDNEQKKVLASRNLMAAHFANSPRYRDLDTTPVRPVNELMVAKYYTSDDENYMNDYNNKEYDLEQYRTYPSVPNSSFYNSDIFSRNRYVSRYRDVTPSMSAFKTGA